MTTPRPPLLAAGYRQGQRYYSFDDVLVSLFFFLFVITLVVNSVAALLVQFINRNR